MRSDRLRQYDILNAIHVVERFKPDRREELDDNLPLQSVLIRFIQIIGEASWRLSQAVRVAHPEVPWDKIASMRHVLVHDYFRVDLNQVWNVATVHVPRLKSQIEAILASLPEDR
jgi:uncharacterized protein with HEPN domain